MKISPVIAGSSLAILLTSLGCGSDSGPETSNSDPSSTGVGGSGNSNSGTGGASSSGTGGSSNVGDYDTSISDGEFSFFAISMKFILSKKPCTGTTANGGDTCLGGFGGDLGGLDGADALCTEAAKVVAPNDNHLWHAFLSVTDYNGTGPVNAIDRIGKGPWWSAVNSKAGKSCKMADNTSGLANQLRPTGDTSTIVFSGPSASMGNGSSSNWPFSKCLTNEYGDCTMVDGDTHDTLTGSGVDGKLYKSATCDDWTSTTSSNKPAFGHTWPRSINDSDASAAHWLQAGTSPLPGCAAIINVSSNNYTSGNWGGGVGSDGGYGGWYCFAVSN
jgi:hypothetical protein